MKHGDGWVAHVQVVSSGSADDMGMAAAAVDEAWDAAPTDGEEAGSCRIGAIFALYVDNPAFPGAPDSEARIVTARRPYYRPAADTASPPRAVLAAPVGGSPVPHHAVAHRTARPARTAVPSDLTKGKSPCAVKRSTV